MVEEPPEEVAVPPIRKAAVWRAVAAAARRAAWERAVCSLVFQSGRMSSLVTTSGEDGGSIVLRFQEGEMGGDGFVRDVDGLAVAEKWAGIAEGCET